MHKRCAIYENLFNELGEICGSANEITPELCIKLGYAAASVASRIAVGYSECNLSKLLAGAFVSAAASAGAQITEIDAEFFAAAAYISKSYLFNLTVFFENDKNRLSIRLVDRFGLPVDLDMQSKLQSRFKSGISFRAAISDIVLPKKITGAEEFFVAAAAARDSLSDFSFAVSGKHRASDALALCLSFCGGEQVSASENVPTFSVSSDGLSLQLRDEKGRWFDSAHTTALVALLSFESGKSQLAVPPDSPSVLEQIAAEYNGKIFRIGRDHGARELFLSQNILCDAFGCAIFISSELSKRKSPLSTLMNLIPDFTLISREISVSGDRSQLLLRLSDMCEGFHRENSGSLRVCADGGWVNILPARKRRFLKITGEGMNEEIASELCNIFVEKTIKADFPHDK